MRVSTVRLTVGRPTDNHWKQFLYDCKKITKLTNVYLINQVSHNELPHYMKRFDIGIIPYIINDFTNSVYNSKLNEYLSVGLPVISTNMNEIKYFNYLYE